MADPMVCRVLRIFGRLDATSTPPLEWQRAIAYSQVWPDRHGRREAIEWSRSCRSESQAHTGKVKLVLMLQRRANGDTLRPAMNWTEEPKRLVPTP